MSECPDPLLDLAELCVDMPNMEGCENFVRMCNGLNQDFEGLCGSLSDNVSSTPFCVGTGTSMMMKGFVWSPTGANPCLNLFLEQWTIDETWKLVLSMIAVVGLGILNGILVRTRRWIRNSRHGFSTYETLDCVFSRQRALRVLQYNTMMFIAIASQLTVAYALMLVVMTYVGIYVLAVIVGVSCGHILFSMEANAFTVDLDPCCQEPNADTSRRRQVWTRKGECDEDEEDIRNYVRLRAVDASDGRVTGGIRLRVGGTTCGSCVKTISQALWKVDGVEELNVSLLPTRNNQSLALVHGNADVSELRRTIERVGFLVLSCERVDETRKSE